MESKTDRAEVSEMSEMKSQPDRFGAIIDELKELHYRKSADYGSGSDPYANVRSSEEFGVPGWVGAMVRGNDKMTRIKSFIRNGNLRNESLEDSLRDLAVYAIIALLLWEEVQPPKVTEPPMYKPFFDPRMKGTAVRGTVKVGTAPSTIAIGGEKGHG